MQGLYNSYFQVSRRDIVSKNNNYTNINEVSRIRYLILSFLKLKNKSFSLLGLSFFFLLSNKKGRILSSSRKSFNKNIGCFLKLNAKDAFSFLEKFLLLNSPRSLDLKDGFLKKSLSRKGTFSFVIDDLHIFDELGEDLFKFQRLKNLSISIVFSKTFSNSNLFLLESIGFKFKD